MNVGPQDPGVKQIQISTFGGLCTNMTPSDVPEGASPDNADVAFIPGSVFNRAPFKRFLPTPLGSNTGTYLKSYVSPTGTRYNLYLDSLGNMWAQDITNAGTPSVLFTVTPHSYAKSVTAFGREYIAISDKIHGSDIPFQVSEVTPGTLTFDRVTQDGPGAPPNITSFAIPESNLMAPAAGPALTLVSVQLTGFWAPGGYYTTATFTVVSGALGLNPAGQITIAGNSNAVFNGFGPVQSIPDDQTIITPFYSTTFQSGSGGTLTGTTAVTLQRQNNIVRANTDVATNLQVGYLAQISGVPASVVGTSIVSIVINNTDSPGIATVTTTDPHGLLPENQVSITGVKPITVGTTISSIKRAGDVVTVVTSASTGLQPGVQVQIAGVTTTSFNTTAEVLSVTTTTNTNDTFTYAQVDVDATDTTGTVALLWPLPATANPTYFEVITAPTATTFQVALNYADGTWTTGSVTFPWDGKFYVTSIISPTSFTYLQYGPNATTASGGLVTPYGQAAPGQHQMQVLFLTRQGYVTRPSPPVKFIANGGQYLQVNNIPIGPSNIVARILALTGADGSLFYYIPDTPMVNGITVGTSTQVNDNTTTSAVLDFGDPTLFSSLGINIPGNNLPNEIVLDGALGFGFFSGRLLTYGQRNTVQSLLNMGFDGGSFPTSPTMPTGWTGGTDGTLTTGHYGSGWTTGTVPLTQSAYENYNGTPILTPNTRYSFRAWLSAAGTVTATISSASTTFSSTVTLTATAAGFYQGNFSIVMPAAIPPDMILGITGSGIVVDEMAIIFSDAPFNLKGFGSYFDNPEGFDGVSGVFGARDDTRQTMATAIIRNTLYLWTQDPAGRVHSINNTGVTEPVGWVDNEVAANCGVISAFCLTVSQADDSSGSGGEEWVAWASATGARIFSGNEPKKISQEIQNDNKPANPQSYPDYNDLNPAAYLTAWAFNDPNTRLLYFGVAVGTATGPNVIFPMNYLGLDTAEEIAGSAPVRLGFSGKLIATDLHRKWTRWLRPMNAGALIYTTASNNLQPAFYGGNGLIP